MALRVDAGVGNFRVAVLHQQHTIVANAVGAVCVHGVQFPGGNNNCPPKPDADIFLQIIRQVRVQVLPNDVDCFARVVSTLARITATVCRTLATRTRSAWTLESRHELLRRCSFDWLDWVVVVGLHTLVHCSRYRVYSSGRLHVQSHVQTNSFLGAAVVRVVDGDVPRLLDHVL